MLINTHLLQAAHGRQASSASSTPRSACVYNADKQRDDRRHAAQGRRRLPGDAGGRLRLGEAVLASGCAATSARTSASTTRVARFHNVYGPHGTWDGGREKAPAAICRKVIDAKLTGKHEIEIWGDGKQTRSFMYIDDCVEGILTIMDSDIDEPINLGSRRAGRRSTAWSTSSRTSPASSSSASTTSTRPRACNGRNSDNTLIKKYLGWEPGIRLRDGMEQTYRWIYDEMAVAVAA